MGSINALPSLTEETEWEMKPAYYLVDYLVANHREFREVDLPAMELIMDGTDIPVYPDWFVIKLISQEFRYFQEEFLKHMAEEESFLFPKILHNEACYRFKDLPPEVYKGSVNLFFRHNRHTPEAEFKRMFTSIREKLMNQALQDSTKVMTKQVIDGLESFERRLFHHADLESNVLFPMAGHLEQELYESIVPGLSQFPNNLK